jgi:membrane protein implicated in regulation of membrane protease activity
MFVVNDLLDAVLLGCFFFGLIFSGLSLFLGIAHLGFDHNGAGHHGGHDADDGLSPISIGSILAFLTWFGGIAYLLRNGADAQAAVSLVLGLGAGLLGGYAVYSLLKRVKSSEAGLMLPGDYSMPGTIGRITSSIREGGTGEIVYEQRGVRQVSAARSSTGAAIPRGTEVVVHRVQAGIAIVEPWSSFVGDEFDKKLEASEREVAERRAAGLPTGAVDRQN